MGLRQLVKHDNAGPQDQSGTNKMSDELNSHNETTIGFIDLYFIVSNLWRRKFTVAAFGLVAGLAAVAFAMSLPDQYVAAARLMIQPEKSQMTGVTGTESVRPINEAMIESNAYMVLSNRILGKVVSDLGLEQNEVFLGETDSSDVSLDLPDLDKRLAMKKLNEVLTVRPVGSSFIVSIEARTESPELSADIANAVAQTFILTEQNVIAEERQMANNWLDEQLLDLRERVNKSSGSLETFRSQIGDVSERKINEISRTIEALRADSERSANQTTVSDTNSLNERIEAREAEIRELTAMKIDLNELERHAEADSALYERLLKRARELQGLETFEVSNIRLVSDALPPLEKSAPQRKLIVILGIILGCAIGAGYVTFRGTAPKEA